MINIEGVLRAVEPADVQCSTRLPLVFDSPHSGTVFPKDFDTTVPKQKILWNSDLHIDKLLEQAPNHGATLLCACFLRSYIDVHRSLDDIDPDMFAENWPEPINPSPKTKLGRGLIRKFADKDLPIYNRLLTIDEIKKRIATYYQPYHSTLQKILEDRYQEFGSVWHVNMHSMPPYARALFEDAGAERPGIAMANKDGTSSSSEFFDLVADTFSDLGYEVWKNKPYKGQVLITAYSAPGTNRHSIQIEVNRKFYMQWDNTLEINEGFKSFKSDIEKMIQKVCGYVKSKIK